MDYKIQERGVRRNGNRETSLLEIQNEALIMKRAASVTDSKSPVAPRQPGDEVIEGFSSISSHLSASVNGKRVQFVLSIHEFVH